MENTPCSGKAQISGLSYETGMIHSATSYQSGKTTHSIAVPCWDTMTTQI